MTASRGKVTSSTHGCVPALQVFAFLGISTTSVLASQSPHAPGIAEEERLRRTAHGQRMLCYLLTIAIVLGVIVVGVLQACQLRSQASAIVGSAIKHPRRHPVLTFWRSSRRQSSVA